MIGNSKVIHSSKRTVRMIHSFKEDETGVAHGSQRTSRGDLWSSQEDKKECSMVSYHFLINIHQLPKETKHCKTV